MIEFFSVTAAIIVLIALIMMIKIHVELHFISTAEEKLHLKISVGRLGFVVLPRRKPANVKKERKKNENDGKQKKKTLNIGIGKILRIVKVVADNVARFATFDVLFINIIAGSSDAATTACNYGKLNAAVIPAFALLDANGKIKKGQTNITADFTAEKIDADIEADVSVRIYGLIILTFGIISAVISN